MDDVIDPSVGFLIRARPGHHVRQGEVLAEILARDEASAVAGRAALDDAFVIGDTLVVPRPLVSHRVTASQVESLA